MPQFKETKNLEQKEGIMHYLRVKIERGRDWRHTVTKHHKDGEDCLTQSSRGCGEAEEALKMVVDRPRVQKKKGRFS